MTRNGSDTKVCASTTAVVVNAIRMPAASRYWPINPSRPKAYSSAMPPTTGGSTSGSRSSGRISCIARPSLRASTSAIGTPNSTHSSVLAAAVFRLNTSAARDGLAGDQAPELRPVHLRHDRDEWEHHEQRPDCGGEVDPARQRGRGSQGLEPQVSGPKLLTVQTLGHRKDRRSESARNGYARRVSPNSYCPVTSSADRCHDGGDPALTGRSWRWRCWSPAVIRIWAARSRKASATRVTEWLSPAPAATTLRWRPRNSTSTRSCATTPIRRASKRPAACSRIIWTPSSPCPPRCWDAGDPRTYTLADHAAAWRNALDATMLSTVLTVQVLGDHLRSGGSIISVVPENPREGSADAAIKAAISNWTEGQATHFGTRGITVNAVASGRSAQEGYAGLGSSAPVAAEIARLALFLSTPAARHITGQTMHVSNGALAQL